MKRKHITFWLDLRKPNEAYLVDLIRELKRGRVFMRAIRDGLMIMYDLLHGRVDALLALYPWVFDRIRAMPPSLEDQLSERLERMEHLMLSNSTEQGRADRAPTRALPPKPTAAPVPVEVDAGNSAQTFLDAFL